MHNDQSPYRELLRQIDHCGDEPLEPIIGQWLIAHTPERVWLQALACVTGSGIPVTSIEDSWRLYALSRVSDALIKLIGKDCNCLRHYITLMEGLGLRETSASCYHPFHHEVVTVTPSSVADAPIMIADVIWPGFMCGPLMIARAGVSVTGGSLNIKKDIAETSTLYWSYRRAGRPTEDLSLGWGHNSQWRTSFRRDYCLGGRYYYNVDGQFDPKDQVLEEHEHLELLRHRCFVVTDRPHADLWPYELQHSEPVDTLDSLDG